MAVVKLMTDAQDGRCWQCGYLLRGVESARCPECGRGFDRADRASMNFGRAMGRVARFLVRPVGRGPVLLAGVGAACVLGTTRWPVAGWHAWPSDVAYYADAAAWRGRAPMTWVDAAYSAGLAAAGAALAWWLLRTVLRGGVIVRYRVPRWQRGTGWARRSLATALLTACGAAGVLAGWPYRLGQRWVAEARVEAAAPAAAVTTATASAPFRPPLALPPDARRAVLRSALSQGWGPRDRLWAVKVCSEGGHEAALIADSIAGERDVATKAWKVHVCGLHREEALGPMFVRLLEDAEPAVRAAAADALGELHHSVSNATAADPDWWWTNSWHGEATDSDPPVGRPASQEMRAAPRATPAGARDALVRLMTAGATAGEREAAARALVHWPPERYRFRYAEWGVFHVDSAGGTRFMDAQLAEVPAFVHRTGDAAASLLGRLVQGPYMISINKPVVHLTVDGPLAVSIEVLIARGRPLVAYPKPDDFFVGSRATRQEFEGAVAGRIMGEGLQAPSGLALPPGVAIVGPPNVGSLDPKGVAALDDPREGYPWLLPRHRGVPFYHLPGPGESTSALMANPPPAAALDDLKGVGLRWQSLIVSPGRLPWMAEAAVGRDPRFAWWERLRKVDCSYVGSRGESERFVYYDGPSLGPAPILAELTGGGGEVLEWEQAPPTGADRAAGRPARALIYVECDGAGGAGAIDVGPYERGEGGRRRLKLPGVARMPADAAERWLDRALAAHGLSAGEAAGLIDCWREGIFKAPGRRLLTVTSNDDYDALCPVVIRPAPTERARVAVFWTELAAPAKRGGG